VGVIDPALRIAAGEGVLEHRQIDLAVLPFHAASSALRHRPPTVVQVEDGALAVVEDGHRVDLRRAVDSLAAGVFGHPRAGEVVATDRGIAVVGREHVHVQVAAEVDPLAVREFADLEPGGLDVVSEEVPVVIVDQDRDIRIEPLERFAMTVIRMDVRDVNVVDLVEIVGFELDWRVVRPGTVERAVEDPGSQRTETSPDSTRIVDDLMCRTCIRNGMPTEHIYPSENYTMRELTVSGG